MNENSQQLYECLNRSAQFTASVFEKYDRLFDLVFQSLRHENKELREENDCLKAELESLKAVTA